MQPHQQRVVDEKRELDDKLDRLQAFMETARFVALDADEKERMARQNAAMMVYTNVLGERIAAFPEAGVYRAMLGTDATVPVGKLGLPQWKCHKVVGAAKIKLIERNPHTRSVLMDTHCLTLEGGKQVCVTEEWIESRRATSSGYYIEYEDGYTSFSPSMVFEKGYTPLNPNQFDCEECQGTGRR